MQPNDYAPIENHGIIGDLNTVALVGTDGTIDFMCYPHFDSPSIFASLLDSERGGRFKLAPILQEDSRKQIYLSDSNVLLTRFLSAEGVAEVSDFMAIEELGHAHDLIRRIKTVRGQIRYEMIFEPRFDYGRAQFTIQEKADGAIFTSQGPDALAIRLRASVPLTLREGGAYAEFTLGIGESASFIMEEARKGETSPSSQPHYVADAFKQTINFWRAWVGKSNYSGRWREMVNRSALTLKLLTSRPHGSIVAAPTFGLPETIGGRRNWDYRYTWVRDASFTLYALIRLGFTEESEAFMRWIEDRCREINPDGSLQIMYGIDGRHELTEEELPHLSGYRDSRPVRIGNGAYDQLQLDIYGELMDCVYLYDKYGKPISYDLWCYLERLIDWVCENWRRPDEGIWEVRGGKREFLFSRVMCWVALDRALRLAQKRSYPAPLEVWTLIRDEIYLDVMNNFWDPEIESFVQYAGSKTVDASCLLMPLVKFVSPTDPRWLKTMAAVEKALVDDSLVFRYRNHADEAGTTHDGLVGEEGTFCMCSFWYVECLSRAGDLEKARFYFEKMLGMRITWVCMPRSWGRGGNTWAISRRPSRTWG